MHYGREQLGPIYKERLLAALPRGHKLARRKALTWKMMTDDIFLVQGWEESQTARELYASFMGSGIRFAVHCKQTVRIRPCRSRIWNNPGHESQAHVRISGVVFRHVLEENAEVEILLVWVPENEDVAVGRFVSFMREMSIFKTPSVSPAQVPACETSQSLDRLP